MPQRADEMARRRLHVERFFASGMRSEEIAAALAKIGIEVTDRTVRRDLEAIRDAWLEAVIEERKELRARELAELRWMERDCAKAYAATKDPRFLTERRQIKTRIATMMGLDAPARFEGSLETAIKAYGGLDPEADV